MMRGMPWVTKWYRCPTCREGAARIRGSGEHFDRTSPGRSPRLQDRRDPRGGVLSTGTRHGHGRSASGRRRQTLRRSVTLGVVISARRCVDASAARCGLVVMVGLIIAGIFAMHVLGSHDQDGEHSTPAGMPAMVTAHSGAADLSSPMDQAPVAAAAGGRTVSAAAGHGMSGSMAGCILFLASVGGLVLVLLLAIGMVGDDRTDGLSARRWWALRGRGPPGTAPPHFSLGVLRV